MQDLDISTIIFAIVAIFVVFKLRSVLGARGGPPRPPVDPALPRAPSELQNAPAGGNVVSLGLAGRADARPDEAAAAAERWKGFAEPGSEIAAGFDAIAAADRGFAPDRFLSGARAAYEMVIGAFAAADLPTLRRLLAPDVLANFDSAIRARLAAGQTMTTTLVSIDAADFVEARLAGSVATVSVRFSAKLASATRDASGAVVEGSASEVADHLDVWTFSRDVRSHDPNWLLAATQTVQ
ncbi:MAG: Tim44/TimA family putative adaptor protein [Roseiarcus sp.]|jgi:predicted lipid-binding transport protein (Tim44 family)